MPFIELNGQVVTLQPGGDSAEDHRKQTSEFNPAPGPVNWASFRPTLVSGLTMNFGQGAAWVRSPNDLSLYRVSQDGVDARITVTTAASNPRVDQIGIRVYDDAVDGSGQYIANMETIDGTPSSGATLDNRTGAPDPSTALVGANAWLPLCDVLVPASGSTISGFRDRRPIGRYGMIPPLAVGTTASNIDQVTMIPAAGQMVVRQQILGSDVNSKQAASLMFLPRAIAATKVRWAYYIDVLGAGSKNFKIAIMDASGRYIADTGNIAWIGTSGNTVRISPSLTLPRNGYIFDVGYYYVMMLHGNGIANTDSLYGVSTYAGNPTGSTVNTVVSGPNIFLGSQSGGLTIPSALQQAGTTFVDMGVNQTSLPQTPVPVITLST